MCLCSARQWQDKWADAPKLQYKSLFPETFRPHWPKEQGAAAKPEHGGVDCPAPFCHGGPCRRHNSHHQPAIPASLMASGRHRNIREQMKGACMGPHRQLKKFGGFIGVHMFFFSRPNYLLWFTQPTTLGIMLCTDFKSS